MLLEEEVTEEERRRYEKSVLRQAEKITTSLYRAIIDAGGLQTNPALREEYRQIPNTFKRKDGLPGDVMAEYLSTHHPGFGVKDERSLIDVLRAP